MGFISNIQAILSADTSDFKSKMDDAGKEAEKLDKQVKKFGLGFGGVAAIATAFRAIVDYARDLENSLDENLRRAKLFTEQLDNTKKGLLEVGAKVLGVVNGIGEWVYRQRVIMEYGKEHLNTVDKIAKQTEETIRAIERDRAITAEVGRLNKETADTKARITEETQKQLSAQDKLTAAVRAHQAAVDVLVASGGDKLATAAAQLQVEQRMLDLVKAQSELDKDKQKRAEEAAKKRAEDADLEYQLTMQRLSEEQKIKDGFAAKQLEKKQAMIDLEKKASAEAAAQVELAKQKADETERWARGLSRGFGELSVSGQGTASLSDRELDAKITNLTRQISEMQMSDRAGGFALSGQDPTGMIGMLTSELQKAKSEADLRSKFAGTLSFFGEQAAFKVAGTEDNFERLMAKINPPDVQKRTATGIEDLNRRLESMGFYVNR